MRSNVPFATQRAIPARVVDPPEMHLANALNALIVFVTYPPGTLTPLAAVNAAS